MTAVLFVHGTGVRAKSFGTTFDLVSRSLGVRRPDLTVHGCFWGGLHGSKLFAQGVSIPVANGTRGFDFEDIPDDLNVMLWDQLQYDPLFELRLLLLADTPEAEGGSFHPGRKLAGSALEDRYRRFATSAAVTELFRGVGLGHEFEPSCRLVAASETLGNLEVSGVASLDAWPLVVRATVAEALRRVERGSNPDLRVLCDPVRREEFIRTLLAVTSEEYRSPVGNWAKQRIATFFADRATSYVTRRREAVSVAASLAGGDVLLYQRDGDAIRTYVYDCIRELEPPVVVIAHSLGGIICVDLFATRDMPDVRLVTVGTAAPLFWELDALWGLRAGAPLPPGFPTWTNIYDQRDFLAYIASPLFGERVRDIQVDTGQPFPRCHRAYWWNDQFWKAVLGACP